MKIIIISILLALTGCSIVTPVTTAFPPASPSLTVDCGELKPVPDNTDKLSEALHIITENYSQYHECKAKVDLWQEWYNEQKKIHSEFVD